VWEWRKEGKGKERSGERRERGIEECTLG